MVKIRHIISRRFSLDSAAKTLIEWLLYHEVCYHNDISLFFKLKKNKAEPEGLKCDTSYCSSAYYCACDSDSMKVRQFHDSVLGSTLESRWL